MYVHKDPLPFSAHLLKMCLNITSLCFRLRHLRGSLGGPVQLQRQPLRAQRRQRFGARPGAAPPRGHGVAGGGDSGSAGHTGALGPLGPGTTRETSGRLKKKVSGQIEYKFVGKYVVAFI